MRTKSTRTCVDCGVPVARWNAERCRACKVKRQTRLPVVYTEPNTSGLCQCGCGQATPISRHDVPRYGLVKGQPLRFLTGHHRRKSPVRWIEEDRGYKTLCWIWQGGIDKNTGYGTAWLPDEKRKTTAHRAVYEEVVGPIPAGEELDHLCRVRECVNPAHLESVTPIVNKRRSDSTKLTEEDVREIRQLAGTATLAELGRRFGVSRQQIYVIIHRTSWRDVV